MISRWGKWLKVVLFLKKHQLLGRHIAATIIKSLEQLQKLLILYLLKQCNKKSSWYIVLMVVGVMYTLYKIHPI